MPDVHRVISYIDGFNLYYGLRNAGYKKQYWLDLHKLSQNLMPRGCEVIKTHYFTSRINEGSGKDKRERQTAFIEALETIPKIQITYGRYETNDFKCPDCDIQQSCYKCKMKFIVNKEKMTDVNIAVSMVVDALRDKYDHALLISADSDLVTAVHSVRSIFSKPVTIAFPPQMPSKNLAKVASNSFTIGKSRLKQCQLPESIKKSDGYEITRPIAWS